ncbi:MAG: peptidylprolyl isomerase [Planctomycetales bacterium]|nr:peptidylprolyl isomerase [Planctomycetales bacterium]
MVDTDIFRVVRLLTIALSLLVVPCLVAVPLAGPARAQEQPDPAVVAAARERFAVVYGDWQQLTQQLETLRAEMGSATVERRTEIRELLLEQFTRLRGQVAELRAASLALYQLSPNQDEAVQEVLVRLAATDLYEDHVGQAEQIVRLMLENRSTFRGVSDLAGLISYCRDDFQAAKSFWREATDQGAISQANAALFQQIDQRITEYAEELEIRQREEGADGTLPVVELRTNKGNIRIVLYRNQAPTTVQHFIKLVDEDFYDSLAWHYVMPNTIAKTGCPIGDGTGTAGETIPSEAGRVDARRHFTGAVSMAIKENDRDSASSQFFVSFRPAPRLDGHNTVFGRVIEGMDVLEQLTRVDASQPGHPRPDVVVEAVMLRR